MRARPFLVPFLHGAAILFAATGSAGASAQAIPVTHARGEALLAATPRRAAVFDLATLDILSALGVDAVAGVPKGSEGKGNLPPTAARYNDARYGNVGTLFEPDRAALTALKPDLIVVAGRSAGKYDEVAGIAPTIDLSSPDKDVVRATIDKTRTLGRIFAVADRARTRVASFEAAVAALRAQGARAGTGLVLFGTAQGVSAHAPGDRFGTVYDFAGIRSAVPARTPAPSGTRPAAGTPEAEAARAQQAERLDAALAADPDWLLVLDRAAATGSTPSTIAASLAANPKIAATRAWKAKRVIYLDPKTWYLVGSGIEALTRSAGDMLAALRSVG